MTVGIIFLTISKKNLSDDALLEPEKQKQIKKSSIYLFILNSHIAGFDFCLPMSILAKEQIIIGFEKKYGWETHCYNLYLRDITLHLQTLQILLCM